MPGGLTTDEQNLNQKKTKTDNMGEIFVSNNYIIRWNKFIIADKILIMLTYGCTAHM